MDNKKSKNKPTCLGGLLRSEGLGWLTQCTAESLKIEDFIKNIIFLKIANLIKNIYFFYLKK